MRNARERLKQVAMPFGDIITPDVSDHDIVRPKSQLAPKGFAAL